MSVYRWKSNAIGKRKPLRRAMKNWCPQCREYVAQKHVCPKAGA